MRYILILLFFISSKLFSQCNTTSQVENAITQAKLLTYKEKVNVFESLLKKEFCKEVEDSTTAKLLGRLAEAYFETNNQEKAINLSKLALQKWEKYQKLRPKGLAYAAYDVGYYCQLSFRYLQAIEYYKKTITYANKNSLIGYCYKLIADIKLSLGDYDGQLLDLQNAEKYAIIEKDNYLLSDILNAQGIALSRLGNDRKAIVLLKYSILNYEEYVKSGEKDENLLANIHVNFGVSYNNLNSFKEAINHLKIAENLFIKLKQYDLLSARVYGLLGLIEAKRKNYPASNQYFIKSIKLHSNEKSVSLSRLYLNFATNYQASNDYEKAIINLQKAIDLFPFLNIKKHNFAIIESKRTLFYILRDYAKNLSAIHQKNKEKVVLNRSLEYFSYADHLLDLMRQEHQGQQSKSFWREHSRSLYESAIEACYLAKDAQKAFYFLEKSRAMLLLDDLKENNARKLLSIAEQEKEKSFQQKLLELQIQLENKKEQSPDYQQIVGKIASTKLAFNDFKKDLEKRFPAYYSVKYNEDFKDLSTMQQWLDATKHQAFVSYFVGDSTTYAMKITPTDTKLVKLPKDKQNIANSFIATCSDLNAQNTNFSSFLKTSNALYHQLIESVGFPEGRIIISYDGYFVPFEAISRSSTKADFLVEHHAISYAYSANFLLKSIENKNPQTAWLSSSSFLGIAPINFSKSLNINNLRLSEKSITNIENTFSGKLLLQKKASKAAFIEQFPNYQLVQLYTHANADTTQKEAVFYLQDAPIRVSEIRQNQTIKTQMIVLSACKTGLGRNVKGEGVFSLSRSFSALGIPSLITTLWSVDEKATYDLTELFYKSLKEGLPKDLALQKAKLTYIRQCNRNELPNLWASSILIGDTSKIDKQSQNWLILLSILCTGLIAFALYKKYK